MIKWDGGGGKGDLLERSRRELAGMMETILLIVVIVTWCIHLSRLTNLYT